MTDENALRVKFELVAPTLDERARRLLLGAEAHTLGRGGVAAVARATGASESTVRRGRDEVLAMAANEAWPMSGGGVRRPGGGRHSLVQTQPGLEGALNALIEPTTRGDPESPLRWTTKSVRNLSAELGVQGFKVGRQVVSELLRRAGYSLQALSKTREGTDSPDRDAQFKFINEEVARAQAARQPVISVDTKRRNSLVTSRTAAKNGSSRADPSQSGSTTSSTPSLGRQFPTASTT